MIVLTLDQLEMTGTVLKGNKTLNCSCSSALLGIRFFVSE